MTDLDMPSLNGLELAEKALSARTDENALEVVLLTAHADLDSAIDAMRIGVFDLLRKPARVLTMKDTLERAHRKSVERRERHRAGLTTTGGPSVGFDKIDTVKVSAQTDSPRSEASDGGSFLSVISHELRTPLNPIIGFSQLIEQQSRTLNEGELKEYARYIREAGESLFELTESVLKVTELRARPPRATPEWVQPGDVLERLRDRHLKAARGRQQTVEIEQGGEEVVHTDADLLEQALAHLLINAVTFSPIGASIKLCARTLGEEIGFQVADDGPGMTAVEIERALRPFEQLDLRHTRSHGGLGVGLTLSALLAECLHGRLDLDSLPDAGTNACIWIPLTKPLIM